MVSAVFAVSAASERRKRKQLPEGEGIRDCEPDTVAVVGDVVERLADQIRRRLVARVRR